VVVLSRGLHSFAGAISTPNLAIVGACPSGAIISAPPGQTALEVERSVVLKDLGLESRDAAALTLDRFATATVDGLSVNVTGSSPAIQLEGGASLSGVEVRVQSTGAALVLDGVVDLEGVELRTDGPLAVDVRATGQLKLVNLRVRGSIVHHGVSLILTDGVLEASGLAVDKSGSGSLTLESLYTSAGLQLQGGRSTLSAVSVEGGTVLVNASTLNIRGVRIKEPSGVGLNVQESDLSGSGLVILGAVGSGLRVRNGSLELSDLVLLDIHVDPAAPEERGRQRHLDRWTGGGERSVGAFGCGSRGRERLASEGDRTPGGLPLPCGGYRCRAQPHRGRSCVVGSNLGGHL
jgi:hypothetical protein